MTKRLFFALIACIAAAPSVAQEPEPLTLETLRDMYADEESKFVTLDGVDIHYKDQGAGYPVVLLHASYMSLHTWDGLAEALLPDYRVIRLDFPNMGLSGAETKEPDGGKFNLIERNVELVSALVDRLGLDRINLVATSSGGSAGFRYASYQPDRVNRMVLINSAGMPRTRATDPNRERADTARWRDMTYKPRAFWEYGLGRNFPSDVEPPAWLVDLVFDINRRKQQSGPALYYFETGDPKTILADVTAPTFIMWGEANTTVMHLEADVFSHWMTSAPTLVKKYGGLGHYPYIEAPDVIIPDIKAFLDGDFDSRLRVTRREQIGIGAR